MHIYTSWQILGWDGTTSLQYILLLIKGEEQFGRIANRLWHLMPALFTVLVLFEDLLLRNREIEEQAHSCLHIWKLVCCQEQHIRVESKNIFWLRNLEDNLKFHCITVWVILFWAEHWAKLSLNWVVCVIKTSAAWYQPRHQQLPHRNESDLLVVSMTHYPLFR